MKMGDLSSLHECVEATGGEQGPTAIEIELYALKAELATLRVALLQAQVNQAAELSRIHGGVTRARRILQVAREWCANDVIRNGGPSAAVGYYGRLRLIETALESYGPQA